MSDVDEVECVVIGAGVVGLAIAKAIAESGSEVVVLEAESGIGTGISSRNSEVIHAGIYYPPGSLKARLCATGRDRLYGYCRERFIPHRRCGKLIVAADERQKRQLEGIRQNAIANGVTDLRPIHRAELSELEPKVAGEFALLSPSTGIIDSHALMVSLQADLEAAGGIVVFRAPVVAGELSDNDIELNVGQFDPTGIKARIVVNSAGLTAQSVARSIGNACHATVPDVHLAVGHYYAYSGPSPFHRLIYPVPEDGGLGVHATLDMDGRVKFGPDVRWIDRVDYRFDDSQRQAFLDRIGMYFPGVDPARLQPDYTGIRPKLSGPGEPAVDFRIDDCKTLGRARLINLFGIESPGLTASLAIGETVAEMLRS